MQRRSDRARQVEVKRLGKKGYRFDRCPVALGGLEWTDMGPRLALGGQK